MYIVVLQSCSIEHCCTTSLYYCTLLYYNNILLYIVVLQSCPIEHCCTTSIYIVVLQ